MEGRQVRRSREVAVAPPARLLLHSPSPVVNYNGESGVPSQQKRPSAVSLPPPSSGAQEMGLRLRLSVLECLTKEIAIMYQQRKGARLEYREQQAQRVKESASLAVKFPQLKSLTANFDYHSPSDVFTSRHLKYVVNVHNAKSVFRFNCPNDECIRGDFDLSRELVNAVAKRRTTVTGEMICRGWRSKATIGTDHCPNRLRYKLRLAYSLGRARRKRAA